LEFTKQEAAALEAVPNNQTADLLELDLLQLSLIGGGVGEVIIG
jgi:hypothetical protein